MCVCARVCRCVSIKNHESHKHVSDVKGARLFKCNSYLFVSVMLKHHEMRHGTWPNTKKKKRILKILYIEIVITHIFVQYLSLHSK